MGITDHEVRDLRLFLLELRYDLVLGCDLNFILFCLLNTLYIVLLSLLLLLLRTFSRIEACAR